MEEGGTSRQMTEEVLWDSRCPNLGRLLCYSVSETGEEQVLSCTSFYSFCSNVFCGFCNILLNSNHQKYYVSQLCWNSYLKICLQLEKNLNDYLESEAVSIGLILSLMSASQVELTEILNT